IAVAAVFVDSAVVRQEITESFQYMIGEQGAQGVVVLMDILKTGDEGGISLFTGLGFLVFSATTIFVQIKNGFNEIYQVRPVEGRKGWLKLIIDRLVSLGIIFSLGFMMLVSLALDTLILSLVRLLSRHYQELSLILLQVAQNLFMLGLAFGIIYALFRWLPDAVVPGRFLLRGALATTLLLGLGKFVIGWYISTTDFTQLGGAAASIVILLLWVYYSSAILYFGAELIKAQTLQRQGSLRPGPFARKIRIVEVE